MSIQVDMFAVELGAAILLQFETKRGPVRILADAGEAQHQVGRRLPKAMGAFGSGSVIDLMIGTHYDADHLAGLVDIINNPSISIGEAWLPPVANDTQRHAADDAIGNRNLLALQLAGKDGDRVLASYLEEKARTCIGLVRLTERSDSPREFLVGREPQMDDEIFAVLRHADRPGGIVAEGWEERALSFFRRHLDDSTQESGFGPLSHGDEEIADPWEAMATVREAERNYLNWHDHDGPPALSMHRAEARASTLALIRRTTARDAINATSLAAVVKALKAKGVAIRCATIPDGRPRRFYWRANERRFSPIRPRGASAGPELLLLGPSDALVRKHWDKLPIGSYMARANLELVPVKPITPSNQLSYIFVVEDSEQRILIAGDAGCVDFKEEGTRTYFPDLIAALSPLQIVQIAHHAGNNAHFYRCLLKSNFPTQEEISYLMLSHATLDKHRPSDVFAKFIESLGRDDRQVRLLFTSTPKELKVRDFKELIASVVGRSRQSGDVRLCFDRRWRVTHHAVRVP